MRRAILRAYKTELDPNRAQRLHMAGGNQVGHWGGGLGHPGHDAEPFPGAIHRGCQLGGCIRQLGYKPAWYGGKIVQAGPFFPSTCRCSLCGRVGSDLPLSQRIFRCGWCDLEMDRDLNAAKNNEQVALVALSCRETVNARESRGVTALGALALGAVPGDEAGTDSGCLVYRSRP